MTYHPKEAIGGGAWNFIEAVDISNQATVEFVLSGTYKMYQVHMTNIVPITDDIRLEMRFSIDGGDTFFSGSNDYSYRWLGRRSTSQYSGATAVQDHISLSGDAVAGWKMGTGTAESLNGSVFIHNPLQSAKATNVTMDISMVSADGNTSYFYGGGCNNDEIGVSGVDAIQIYAFSGNLSTGRIELYGLRLS
jgi:hypothetical protein